jgi:RNA polymerase sigma-B factor
MTASCAAVDRFLAYRSAANREAVIAAYFHLCKRAARKFRRRGTELIDLEQVAALGLIKATDAFRPERTTPFEAYAWIVIVGELMHYVRDHERAVRIPRRLRTLDRRYVRAWEELAARRHAEPTAGELASELDVDRRAIDELRLLGPGTLCPCGESGLENVASALPGIAIEDRLTLMTAIDALDQRERTIVLATFGAGLSQAEVAAALQLSQGQISKLLSRAIAKLKLDLLRRPA